MRIKKRYYKFIQLLAVIGIVCLVQGMALVGSLYYTNNYSSHYVRDAEMPDDIKTMELMEAEFYNFRMMIYSGAEISNALASMEATKHTNEVGLKLHRIYQTGRNMLWIGLLFCVFAFVSLRRRKIYNVLLQGAVVALAFPVVVFLFLLLVRFRVVVNAVACVLFSCYHQVFYDDPAFVSILPRGVFAGYLLVYIGIWLVASMVFLAIYMAKKKHRSPHEF